MSIRAFFIGYIGYLADREGNRKPRNKGSWSSENLDDKGGDRQDKAELQIR
jgi:hypothetical protein